MTARFLKAALRVRSVPKLLQEGMPDSAAIRLLLYDYIGRKDRAVYDALDTFYLSLAASSSWGS